IRHGESQSNLNKSGLSGWSDSPLTELGIRQADELGKSFQATGTSFTYLYSSDLSRAHNTALIILKHINNNNNNNNNDKPKSSLILTPQLREINFGKAEGHPYTPGDYPALTKGQKTLEELYEEGIFPDFRVRGRDAKFPLGESLNELEYRVKEIIKDVILLPLVLKNKGGGEGEDWHVGFVSHGLCLFEMVNALLKLDLERNKEVVLEKYRGHHNTGWTRLEISLKVINYIIRPFFFSCIH
ncbi:hypothetical protein AGABI1DRAFT_36365, partial [Agaricus bisporus var. burnettii JB137-S8]